jgi:peptidoglycan/LPS O-acetylase OafA/YrhL
MENIQGIADKSAIVLSFLCALHCLLLPAAIVLYPSTLGFLPGDESVHFALLFLVIPISAYALVKGGKVHKSRKVFITGISGLLVLVAAVVLGHDILGEIGEKILTVLGSIIVIIAHVQNHLICRATDCECHDEVKV